MIIKFADPSCYPLAGSYLCSWHVIDNCRKVHWELLSVPYEVSLSDFVSKYECEFVWFWDDYKTRDRVNGRLDYTQVLKINYIDATTGIEHCGFVNTVTWLLNDEGKTIERIFG
jgi:hypothetical protein